MSIQHFGKPNLNCKIYIRRIIGTFCSNRICCQIFIRKSSCWIIQSERYWNRFMIYCYIKSVKFYSMFQTYFMNSSFIELRFDTFFVSFENFLKVAEGIFVNTPSNFLRFFSVVEVCRRCTIAVVTVNLTCCFRILLFSFCGMAERYWNLSETYNE